MVVFENVEHAKDANETRHDWAADEEPTPVVTQETSVMTQEQSDALAERIAAVLRERKDLAYARRRRQREYQGQNGERPPACQYKLREHFREQSDDRVEDIDAVYAAIMASNAAV